MAIPHNKPTLGKEEADASARVIHKGWIAQGPEVGTFEDELCKWFDLPVGHAVVVSSGSAALYFALVTLQAKGKRVGVPVYSCSALTNAVHLVGAKAVFLDTALDSPNFDPQAAKTAKLDILIAPSIFGIPTNHIDMPGLYVIEDIAQSFGARSNGEHIGIRGDIGVCSFYATKMFTTGGQGGAVISRDLSLIEAVRDMRQFDGRADRHPRFNFQITDMQAAVGREQLKRLPKLIDKRETLFKIYRSKGLPLLEAPSQIEQPVRFRAVIRCKRPKKIIEILRQQEVHAIIPVEPFEILAPESDCPNSYNLARTTLSLPIFPDLNEIEAQRIAEIVSKNI